MATAKKASKRSTKAAKSSKSPSRGTKLVSEKDAPANVRHWPQVGDRVRLLRSAAGGRVTGEIVQLHKGHALIEFEDGTAAGADKGTYEPFDGNLPEGTIAVPDATEATMISPVIGPAGPVMSPGPNTPVAGLTLPTARTRDAQTPAAGKASLTSTGDVHTRADGSPAGKTAGTTPNPGPRGPGVVGAENVDERDLKANGGLIDRSTPAVGPVK